MSILFSFHIQLSPDIDQRLAVLGSRFIYVPDVEISSLGYYLQRNGPSRNRKSEDMAHSTE